MRLFFLVTFYFPKKSILFPTHEVGEIREIYDSELGEIREIYDSELGEIREIYDSELVQIREI